MAALQAPHSRSHVMAAFTDVPMIKSLRHHPSMDLLAAPAVGISVTSQLCKSSGEGDAGGLKALFHPRLMGQMQQGAKHVLCFVQLPAEQIEQGMDIKPKPHADGVREITPVPSQVWCYSQAVHLSSGFL